METLEQLRDRLTAQFPAATITLVTNPGPAAEHSLLLDAAHAHAISLFLRDDAALRLDYCSNVTGVDWPDKDVTDIVKITVHAVPVAGVADPGPTAAKIVEEKTTRRELGCLEAVYHLYSMARKHGPVVIRMRTANRTDAVTLPSLTPIWRAADFQEREIFDLFGIVFSGHPDLRRILMWDEFKDHPMRKDYVDPDDYEWEPTAHGAIAEKAKAQALAPVAGVADPGPSPKPGSPSPATKEGSA